MKHGCSPGKLLSRAVAVDVISCTQGIKYQYMKYNCFLAISKFQSLHFDESYTRKETNEKEANESTFIQIVLMAFGTFQFTLCMSINTKEDKQRNLKKYCNKDCC